MLKRSNLQPKVRRLNVKCSDLPVSCLRDVSLSRQRDLIQTIFTMDHPRVLRPKRRQHVGEFLRQILAPYADDLSRRACRITHWTKQIECRVNTELSSNACHSRSRAVIKRRKHETDVDIVKRVLRYQRNR